MRTICRPSPVVSPLLLALACALPATAQEAGAGDDTVEAAEVAPTGDDAEATVAGDDVADAAPEAPAEESAVDEASAEEPPAAEPSSETTSTEEAAPDTADDAARAAAIEAESDNLRRALYAGIGMGALGVVSLVASVAMTAGAAAMIFAPGVDPAISTQGGPLLWFGLSGVLVGLVTSAAGGGLITWSLISDPEEAGIAGSAEPDASGTQQNAPPMAR